MNSNEFHASRKFVNTSFGRIAYVERGTGPVALFLHGFPLSGFQWRDICEDLASERRSVIPDLMGLGYSEIAPAQDLSFAAQANMLASLLDELKIDSVDLIGNDSGGGISQMFATAYPARVRTWTLTDCEVHNLWPNPMLQQLFDAFESGIAIEAVKLMARDLESARQQLSAVYENPATVTDESIKTYFEPLVANETRTAQLQKFASAKTNVPQLVSIAPKLKANRIPVQIIWGEADTTFDRDASLNWLRDNLSGLKKMTLVPRAKLFFPEEHPRLVSVLLREFWRSQA